MEERQNPRRRRRKRINWTGVIFWLVILVIIITVIALLTKSKDNAELPTDPDTSFMETLPPLQDPVEQTDEPTEEPTAPPTEPPTEPPTDPPTEPPTEEPTEEPTQAPTEATAGVDDEEVFSTVAAKVTAIAESAMGLPFEFGGSGPGSFDTSGFVYYCFQECDIPAPRLVSDQYAYGTAVAKEDLRAGDVVFFSVDNPGTAEYVGIYVGDGMFIAARSSINAIGEMSINSAYFTERYVGARRYY